MPIEGYTAITLPEAFVKGLDKRIANNKWGLEKRLQLLELALGLYDAAYEEWLSSGGKGPIPGAASLAEEEPMDLVLRILREEGGSLDQPTLAKHSGMDDLDLRAVLIQLERLGLAEREPIMKAGRPMHRVTITKLGRAVGRHVAGAADALAAPKRKGRAQR